MARPQKEGVDYFPLDVHLDIKFDLIEAEYGITGFGIVVKLLQKIYGGNGYYIEWTSEVALLFAKSVGLGGNVVSEIVTASIRRGIFNNDMYEQYKILTSTGIQKRYLEMVGRRKEITVINDYVLVNVAHLNINVISNPVNVNINSKNANTNKQSKVNKSKVNKTKVNKTKELDSAELFEIFWNCYPNKKSKQSALKSFEKLNFSEGLFEKIIKAVEIHKKTEQWIKDNGKFIPHPATWLNNKRWEDGVIDESKNDTPLEPWETEMMRDLGVVN